MKLVNVRLDDQDARVVARLRARGVSISEVVRRALRAEDQRERGAKEGTTEILADMLARFPTPPGASRHGVSSLDRSGVRKLIRSKLLSTR